MRRRRIQQYQRTAAEYGYQRGNAARHLRGAGNRHHASRHAGSGCQHSLHGDLLMAAGTGTGKLDGEVTTISGCTETYMLKRISSSILGVVVGLAAAVAQAQTGTATVPPCPGYNPINNTNLAC